MPSARASDGTAIAYESAGEGPLTLMLLHGWAGSRRYFEPMVDQLDLDGVRVVSIDLRGHGESGDWTQPYTNEQIAGDVVSVADGLGIDGFVAVGFSMSAKFVQFLPLVQPRRVRGLILVAGCPAGAVALPPAMLEDWYGRAGDAARMAELTASFASRPIAEDVLERFGRDAAGISRAALEQTMELCTTSSFADRLDALDVPALVVGGQHDPLFTPDLLREGVVAPLHGARLAVLDAGHEVPVEQPNELAAVVEAFIAGLGPRRDRD